MPHKTEYTEFRPSEYPPFPEGEDFPCVPLASISLQKLIDHDTNEENRVLEACKGRGFFYLELDGAESGETILEGSGDICRVAEDFYQLPMVRQSHAQSIGDLDQSNESELIGV